MEKLIDKKKIILIIIILINEYYNQEVSFPKDFEWG
jgi:hypothetical protein